MPTASGSEANSARSDRRCEAEVREGPGHPFVPRRARPRPRARHSLGLQQFGVGDALQPVRQQLEGAALWQQHEQAIQGLDQVRVALHVQQLQAQVCGRAEGRGSGWL